MKTFVLKVTLKKEVDGRWSASIPVLPGCWSWGSSQHEALENMKDAAEIYIEDMIDAGERLPQPSNEIEIIEEPAIAVSLWFTNSKIPLSGNSFGQSGKMGFNTKGVKEAKGFIATLTVDALLFIFIMLETPCHPALLRIFYMEQDGMRPISYASD